MTTRKISDIIEDLRASAKNGNLDISELQKNTEERASELEVFLAKEKSDAKFMMVIGSLAILFSVAVAFITSMSNNDLREDVTQKKDIITKFEQAVRHDTIHTYFDENGKEITIPSLLDDNLMLMNKINDLEYKIDLYKMKLRDIEIRYGIKVVDDKALFHLDAKKVDSALILLPVFRDKMAFDSTRSQWTISIETEKMNKK